MVMNVTSMLSSGYLRPTLRSDAPQGAVLTETIDRSARTQQRQDQTLARQERQVLAEEQGLRVSAGPSAEVTTVYHYTLGSDGKRYITGASVMMKGDREDLERVTGGRLSEAAGSAPAAEKGAARTDGGRKKLPGGENPEEDAVIRELRNTEREVIAHEAAHQAAAGRFGGVVSYTRTTGPDGKSYITGGQVPIHFVTGSTPEETLRNMEQIQRAALAPGDPSGQDIRVAARAAAAASKARHEITQGEEKHTGKAAASGAKLLGTEQGQDQGPVREDPAKTGVSSILAALRFQRLQASPA